MKYMLSEKRLVCVLCGFGGSEPPWPPRDELHAPVYGDLESAPCLDPFVALVDSQCHLVDVCGLSFPFSN